MAAKTVALDPEAYALLAKAKQPGETFSDVVKRSLHTRRPLVEFAGAWKHLSAQELRLIRGSIAAGRKGDAKRLSEQDLRPRPT